MLNLCVFQGTVIGECVYVISRGGKHRLAFVWVCHERPKLKIRRVAKGNTKANKKRYDKRRSHDYVRLKLWDGNADFAKRYFEPGVIVTVDGKLQNDLQIREGKYVRRLVLLVSRIHSVGSRDWDPNIEEKLLEFAKENNIEDGEILKDQEPPEELEMMVDAEDLDWGSSWLGLKLNGRTKEKSFVATAPKNEAPLEGETWDVPDSVPVQEELTGDPELDDID